MAWDDEIALIDPLVVDVGALHSLLSLDVPCVMHAASQDLPILQRLCGTRPMCLIDTQVAAGFVGLGTPGLASLLDRQLRLRLPKADRLTDWLQRPLGTAAATYAATDVEHLHELWSSLEAELRRRGRLSWALEECEQVRLRAGQAVAPDEAWWKIKDARRLKGRSRCIAQAVAAWRETRAQEIDRPARHVLPDLALVAIADRPPANRTDLQRVRGLDGRHLRGDAEGQLLRVIHAAREMPEDRLRLPERNGVDPEYRPAVALASAWVGQMARDLEVDSSLLATRADIEALVADDHSSRLLSGWRQTVAGDEIRALLRGDAALAFGGNRTLVLEARSHRSLSEAEPAVNQ